MAQTARWSVWHLIGLLGVIGAIIAVGLLTPLDARLWAYGGTLALLFLLTALIGQGVTGLWSGVLIDERNRLSLERLQIILWTDVVLAGFYVAVMSNLTSGAKNALAVTVPREVWVLMGIGMTSMTASPLIRSTKENREANPEQLRQTMSTLARQRGVADVSSQMTNRGQVMVNLRPQNASLSDFFTGQEVGNAAHLEMGQIQLFYFTVILIITYASAIGQMLLESGPIHALPAPDDGLLALLGISHLGFLTLQAIPRSRTEGPVST